MSSNTYILIRKKGRKYIISIRDFDSDTIGKEYIEISALNALRRAGKMQGTVEYGIVFED